MKHIFVHTVSNVARFEAGLKTVEGRGAREACFMLVEGEAGFGKTETGKWWAVQNDAVLIRAKAAATYHWVLADILRNLNRGLQPKRRCEDLYDQVYVELARQLRPIVIDEVENLLNEPKAIQAVRDLSDYLEIPVVLIAREYVKPTLRQRKEIWTRISEVVEFGPATVDDVRLCSEALSEATIEQGVIDRIHRESEGYIREILNGIAAAERIGLRNRGVATVEACRDRPLIKDFQRSKPSLRVVG